MAVVPHASLLPTDPSQPDERVPDVVADVAHALRNHFHRLHYWIELLHDLPVGDAGRSALDAAAASVGAIERLTTGALALTRPVELSCVRMALGEVADGIAARLRRLGADVRARPVDEAGALAIDPGQVSTMIESVGRRLGVSAERAGAVDLVVEIDAERWAVFAMQTRAVSGEVDDDIERMLEWARAERTAAAHGGRLVWETAGATERRVVLVLPLLA